MDGHRRHPTFVLLALAGLTAVVLGACSPSYEDRVTLCSMGERKCPSGWACDVNGVCHSSKASADDAGRAVDVPPGVGTDVPADVAAEVAPDVTLDMTTPVSPGCTSMAPVGCPATGDRPATCLLPGYSCASVMICGMAPSVTVTACPAADQVADCVGGCLPAATCNAIPAATPCERCIVQKCCSLVLKCAADTTCDTTESGPLWNELLACGTASCTTICSMP
jgi:hypothetical protein